jgi:DNA-binding NtrC family response regulator
MNRVLVVEDHAETREVVCQLLADIGYVVAGVDSAERAIEELRTKAYDVLVVDYWLTGEHTGAWLIREARRVGLGVPAVLCTAERAVPDAPTDVTMLLKPIDIGELVEHVERLARAPAPSRRSTRPAAEPVRLVFYITASPSSIRALRNLHRFLNRLPPDSFTLEVIDIARTPQVEKRIAFTPLLVKEGPTPERLAGDLRDTGALEDMIGGASR